jgi:hypothetical protein
MVEHRLTYLSYQGGSMSWIPDSVQIFSPTKATFIFIVNVQALITGAMSPTAIGIGTECMICADRL